MRNKDNAKKAQYEEGEVPDDVRPSTRIDDNIDRQENMKNMFSNNNENFRQLMPQKTLYLPEKELLLLSYIDARIETLVCTLLGATSQDPKEKFARVYDIRTAKDS